MGNVKEMAEPMTEEPGALNRPEPATPPSRLFRQAELGAGRVSQGHQAGRGRSAGRGQVRGCWVGQPCTASGVTWVCGRMLEQGRLCLRASQGETRRPGAGPAPSPETQEGALPGLLRKQQRFQVPASASVAPSRHVGSLRPHGAELPDSDQPRLLPQPHWVACWS